MFLLTLVEHRFREFAVKKLSRSMAQLLVRAHIGYSEYSHGVL